MNLSKINTSSRRSQIRQTLRAAVLAGELDVGVIYSAPTLATQLGVSATPVREAMMELANEGMIEIVRNKGFRINQPTPKEFGDVLEVRLMLEVPIIKNLAARGLNFDQKAAALQLAEASLEAAERADLVTHVAADIRFHLYLISLWGNDEIVNIVRVMRSRNRLFGLGKPDNRSFLLESAQEHIELVQLICSGDTEKTEFFIEQHIRKASGIWTNSVS